MLRSVLSAVLIMGALTLGVIVAGLASRNRARGADLDQRQHLCETLVRQNKIQRAHNQRAEYRLIQGEGRASRVEPISH